MIRRQDIVSLVIAGLLLSFDGTMRSAADDAPSSPADSTSRFDLPAESLDKALRDFAVQANCNIAYEPAVVAGLQAPAIKGEYLPRNVLVIMLTGTRLRAVNVNEDTIQVVEKSATSRVSRSTDENQLPRTNDVVRISYAGAEAPGSAAAASDSTTQDSKPPQSKSKHDTDLDEITVTGSHIRGVSTASPVIEIGREEIERSGYTSISDVMLSLPQNFGGGYNPGTAVYNSQASARFADNTTGASVANLRGLGPGSTLTLVDGHRMASGLSGGGVDLSSIPLAAIDRIEVVTDSASSIYGSDAVAGVVNIILKRNYIGAKTSVSDGIATQGGGNEKRISQLLGTTWRGGSLMAAYEHDQQDAVYSRDRAFTSGAFDPNSLLPKTKSNALTLSLAQEISATTTAYVDGLLISRDANRVVSEQLNGVPLGSSSTLRKYAITGGFDVNLPHEWKLSLFFDTAADRSKYEGGFLGVAPYPASDNIQFGTMHNIELNANGRVATLPTGPMRLAVGAGYRKESFSDAFGYSGKPYTDVPSGDRNVRYAFGELSVPLLAHSNRPGRNQLDLIVSARNEHYSDFGGKTIPKVGLVYTPASAIKFRATWGKAFKAPNLHDIDDDRFLDVLTLSDPASSSGMSNVLYKTGGNPTLKPETAEAWSVGFDFAGVDNDNFRMSTTVFNINYTNRITQISDPYAALNSPFYAFFVQRNPSPAAVQALYDSYPASNVFNYTGAAYDPASIVAIADYRLVNVARQIARGADWDGSYRLGTAAYNTTLFANLSYLHLSEKDTPQSPEQTISGLAFYPPKFRARGGATWKANDWALTGTINYLSRETNTQVSPAQGVSSWTTMDASVRYAPDLSGAFSGWQFSLAAINLFDRDPPFAKTPDTVVGVNFNFDSSNTNLLGRFITLAVSKEW